MTAQKSNYVSTAIGVVLIIGTFLLPYSVSAEVVSKNCELSPQKFRQLTALNTRQKYLDQAEKPEWKKAADADYAVIKAKGRTYLHSLPDVACKSDVFIIQGDVVEYIDDYSGIDDEKFALIIYFSKTMRGDIAGWIPSDSLCRMTAGGDARHCGVRVRR